MIGSEDIGITGPPVHSCVENVVMIKAGYLVSYYKCSVCGKEFRLTD